MDAESGERVRLAEIAERCRDEPMTMAEIIWRAAELLRVPTMIDGRSDWFEKRDQWLKDAAK
jgi:hypothetical protein